MKTLLGGFIISFWLSLLALTAQADDVIKFGFAAEPHPPFASKDAAGNWNGFEADLMHALCAEMKSTCQLVPVAWDGIIPSLTEKKIDVIFASMAITAEREKIIDFSDRYYDSTIVLTGLKDDGIKIGTTANPDGAGGKIVNPADVKGKIIAVQTSTIHANYVEKYLSQSASIKLYDALDNALADLAAGRVDLVAAEAIAMSSVLKSEQGQVMEVKITLPRDPILGLGAGAGLRKGDGALKERINAAIKAIRANGTYNAVAKKYFDFDIYGS